VAHVELERNGVQAFVAQSRGGGLHTVEIDIGQRDARTSLREPARDREAEAAGGASDEGGSHVLLALSNAVDVTPCSRSLYFCTLPFSVRGSPATMSR